MRKGQQRSAHKNDALPPEIGRLLQEIEKEPVPERLLDLARQLQDALAQKRRQEEVAEDWGPPVPSSAQQVKQAR